MKSLGKHMKSMMSDERGSISHKRLISVVGTLVLAIALLFNFKAMPELISALEFIVITAIGSTAVDKFSYKQPINTTENGDNI